MAPQRSGEREEGTDDQEEEKQEMQEQNGPKATRIKIEMKNRVSTAHSGTGEAGDGTSA